MIYDCLIIGGGISGLTCGIRCSAAGLNCAILSSGMSSLHFSSGSIDLMGYDGDHRVVYEPFEYLESFIASHPRHPYAKCGTSGIRDALFFFRDQLSAEDLELYNNEEKNHFHVSALGTLKPTYFSQRSVFNEKVRLAFQKRSKIAVLNFSGYRDFHPALAISNLRKNRFFSDIEIVTGNILFPDYGSIEKNPFEFRSIDIARIFDTEKFLEDIAGQIRREAQDAEFASLPAFIGINNYKRHHQLLQQLTGLLIYEIPTLPPSILGMRIDNALKSRFAALGGVYIAGDTVTGGAIENGMITHITTKNNGASPVRASQYVLATGSFFSGGLISDAGGMREPIFNLKADFDAERRQWHSPSLFAPKGHPFLEYGVATDESLHPVTQDGDTVKNLYCTGALLSGCNPVREGCGGGSAVATGYHAAEIILTHTGKKHDKA